jgi:hypothetical protein
MANDDDALCLSCDHPKSEHEDNGCMHQEIRFPQPHGNLERQLCTCDEFRPKLGKGFQVRQIESIALVEELNQLLTEKEEKLKRSA